MSKFQFHSQICVFRGILFGGACVRSSKVLHYQMFNGILHAPMSFFDKNPSGPILNRISGDIGAIDGILRNAMLEAVSQMFNICGILILIIISDPCMIGAIFIIFIIYGLTLKLYLRASQDLKRLEGICEFCNKLILEFFQKFVYRY